MARRLSQAGMSVAIVEAFIWRYVRQLRLHTHEGHGRKRVRRAYDASGVRLWGRHRRRHPRRHAKSQSAEGRDLGAIAYRSRGDVAGARKLYCLHRTRAVSIRSRSCVTIAPIPIRPVGRTTCCRIQTSGVDRTTASEIFRAAWLLVPYCHRNHAELVQSRASPGSPDRCSSTVEPSSSRASKGARCR